MQSGALGSWLLVDVTSWAKRCSTAPAIRCFNAGQSDMPKQAPDAVADGRGCIYIPMMIEMTDGWPSQPLTLSG